MHLEEPAVVHTSHLTKCSVLCCDLKNVINIEIIIINRIGVKCSSKTSDISEMVNRVNRFFLILAVLCCAHIR